MNQPQGMALKEKASNEIELEITQVLTQIQLKLTNQISSITFVPHNL